MAPDASTSQVGRTFVVTGPTGGVGEATAIALGAAGANVVLACRNVDKGARVAETIGPRASVHRLDLSELASVRKFACGLRDTHETIDVLINNAGVMAVPLQRTADGFEMQMGTNYFGHFALTGLLLDMVTDRVVTVSSAAHRLGRVDLDDPNWEQRRYHRAAAYAQSKLANLMFSFELARRLDASGSTVRSLAAHPGYAATEVGSHTGTWFDRLFGFGKKILQRTPEQGAESVLYAATEPGLRGGYIGPDGFLELYGSPHTAGCSARARDPEAARRLWELSERVTGVRFGL
ncbi:MULTISPECIES: oxidoreductase [unclassified Rhodococcus (in: high G+C Gram-positive bacteria)]|uniref:oxidoreductase n=1 Tax=unclassified Rhodococcus (in: high G+C Gram-positive bacteria) TaxID=192944 RepID=UPI001469C02D|nr:oxidoreductase [Rhodococcus sp. BL-253-APC-6A1W]NMD95934.1 SDR family NAD(P)-dependent oxidoreductase [Rhodococcus sp. BL-253-APC-6A1W]